VGEGLSSNEAAQAAPPRQQSSGRVPAGLVDRVSDPALVEDILILVTSFFRDPKIYDELGERCSGRFTSQ